MYIESTATLRDTINAAKFQVGTGLYPRPDSKPKEGGNIIGGGALYIMKSRPAEGQQAAGEVVKDAMRPANQAPWEARTRHHPIPQAAFNKGPRKERAAQKPPVLTAG